MSTLANPLPPVFYEGRFFRKKLYNIIQTPVGKPDLNTIVLLEEIVDKYRAFIDKTTRQKRARFKGDIWQVAYKYFEKIYGKCHQTIRRSLKKLEELGFIERIERPIFYKGNVTPRALHIKLNISRLYDIFFSPPTLQICTINYINNNLSSLIKEKKKDYYRSSYSLAKDSLAVSARTRARAESNFSKKSSLEGSDFLKNLSNLESDLTGTAKNIDREGCNEVLANKREILPPSGEENKHRGLATYLPLTDAECLESAKRAGKDFTPKETNFILRKISQTDLGKKYDFSSRERVINYAVKLLQNERREPGFLDDIREEKAQKPEEIISPFFPNEEKIEENPFRVSSYNITLNYLTKKEEPREPRVTPLKGQLISIFEPGKAPGDKIIRDILKELQRALGQYPKYEARFQYLEEAKINEKEKLVLLKMKHRGAAFVMDRDFRYYLDSFFQAKGYAYKLLFRQEDGEYGIYYESWWN